MCVVWCWWGGGKGAVSVCVYTNTCLCGEGGGGGRGCGPATSLALMSTHPSSPHQLFCPSTVLTHPQSFPTNPLSPTPGSFPHGMPVAVFVLLPSLHHLTPFFPFLQDCSTYSSIYIQCSSRPLVPSTRAASLTATVLVLHQKFSVVLPPSLHHCKHPSSLFFRTVLPIHLHPVLISCPF